MSSGKVGSVAGKLTVLITAGNVRGFQQRLVSRPKLAVATGDAPVFILVRVFVSERAEICRQRLPAGAFAEWTNLNLGPG